MAISAQLNRQLHDIFLNRGAIQFPDYIKPNLAFENNNVFKKDEEKVYDRCVYELSYI